MQDELPWSHVIELASVPPEGRTFTLEPDETTRARLAKVAEVVAIPSLKAVIEVRPAAVDGADVTGALEGVVRQTCVVSLEEFDNKIAETISADFAPDPQSKARTDDEEEIEDLPDPIIDGKIDLGALATEFLILAVDPYPRKPGAELDLPAVTETLAEAAGSPFDRLLGFKEKLKK